jgi:hypothetical protein
MVSDGSMLKLLGKEGSAHRTPLTAAWFAWLVQGLSGRPLLPECGLLSQRRRTQQPPTIPECGVSLTRAYSWRVWTLVAGRVGYETVSDGREVLNVAPSRGRGRSFMDCPHGKVSPNRYVDSCDRNCGLLSHRRRHDRRIINGL